MFFTLVLLLNSFLRMGILLLLDSNNIGMVVCMEGS